MKKLYSSFISSYHKIFLKLQLKSKAHTYFVEDRWALESLLTEDSCLSKALGNCLLSIIISSAKPCVIPFAKRLLLFVEYQVLHVWSSVSQFCSYVFHLFFLDLLFCGYCFSALLLYIITSFKTHIYQTVNIFYWRKI